MDQNTSTLSLANSQDSDLYATGYSITLPEVIDNGLSNKIDYLLNSNEGTRIECLDNFRNHYFNNNLLNNFYLTKHYEIKYSDVAKSSEDLFKKWKNNELKLRNSEINEWLSVYMQIKDSLHYGKN